MPLIYFVSKNENPCPIELRIYTRLTSVFRKYNMQLTVVHIRMTISSEFKKFKKQTKTPTYPGKMKVKRKKKEIP